MLPISRISNAVRCTSSVVVVAVYLFSVVPLQIHTTRCDCTNDPRIIPGARFFNFHLMPAQQEIAANISLAVFLGGCRKSATAYGPYWIWKRGPRVLAVRASHSVQEAVPCLGHSSREYDQLDGNEYDNARRVSKIWHLGNTEIDPTPGFSASYTPLGPAPDRSSHTQSPSNLLPALFVVHPR